MNTPVYTIIEESALYFKACTADYLNMKPGDWYKKFGRLEDQHDTVETYYHIVTIEDESVSLDEYSYYTHFQRLIKVNKKPITYNLKKWLEENIKNNVYEVSRDSLPFILSI